jgi:dTMP kinase
VTAPGRLITFEGIDGAGKSTQVRHLAETLRAAGRHPIVTREPGGSPGAEAIRSLLVEGAPDRWSPETEILLFTAARRDHCERTIEPALAAGRDVVSDRFADSTRVYQGAVRADLRGLVDDLHGRLIGREPDVTIVLDVDPAAAGVRGLGPMRGEDRFEAFGLPFQAALREGFLALARSCPGRCHVVDGMRDPARVAEDVARIVTR